MKRGGLSREVAKVLGLVVAAGVLGAVTFSSCGKGKEPAGAGPAPAHELYIRVDETGYHPETMSAPAGERVRLKFERTADDGCGQQLFFPKEKIRRDLPLNEPVNVDITMPASGSVTFTCHMEMLKGEVRAQ